MFTFFKKSKKTIELEKQQDLEKKKKEKQLLTEISGNFYSNLSKFNQILIDHNINDINTRCSLLKIHFAKDFSFYENKGILYNISVNNPDHYLTDTIDSYQNEELLSKVHDWFNVTYRNNTISVKNNILINIKNKSYIIENLSFLKLHYILSKTKKTLEHQPYTINSSLKNLDEINLVDLIQFLPSVEPEVFNQIDLDDIKHIKSFFLNQVYSYSYFEYVIASKEKLINFSLSDFNSASNNFIRGDYNNSAWNIQQAFEKLAKGFLKFNKIDEFSSFHSHNLYEINTDLNRLLNTNIPRKFIANSNFKPSVRYGNSTISPQQAQQSIDDFLNFINVIVYSKKYCSLLAIEPINKFTHNLKTVLTDIENHHLLPDSNKYLDNKFYCNKQTKFKKFVKF